MVFGPCPVSLLTSEHDCSFEQTHSPCYRSSRDIGSHRVRDAILNLSARMSELLERFFQAADWPDIMNLARELSVRDDPSDVPGLQAALRDPLEARRYGAAYA